MGLVPVLMWEAGGVTREYRLKPGIYIIGRLKEEHLEKLPSSMKRITGIYILPVEPEGKPIYTGIEDHQKRPRVSRLHAKIIYRDNTITIIDHGKEGKGSTNGTIINGKKIQKGESLSIKLGEQVVLTLAPGGPKFILTAEETSTKTITLTVTSNTPTIIPESIARQLEKQGLVQEKAPGPQGYTMVVLKDQPWKQQLQIQNINMQIQHEPKRQKLVKTLQRLLETLHDLHQAIIEGRLEEAKIYLEALRLETVQNAILELHDKKLENDYRLLIEILQTSPTNAKQLVKSVIYQLRILQEIKI